jgi:hypothetical protein
MRSLGSATLTHLQAREGVVPRILCWFSARNRSTNAVETMGLWTGSDHQTITVEGLPRVYYGAGNVIDLPPLTMEAGLSVRMYRLGLAGLTPEVAQLIRGYDIRFAPVQIHRAMYSPTDRSLIEAPHRVLFGFVDEVDWETPPVGGESRVTLSIATSSRVLTQDLPLTFSDATIRRAAGDRFFRHGDVSRPTKVWWGQKSAGGRSE